MREKYVHTCSVHHSNGDADTLIVTATLKSAETKPTVLIGDDTDLLVLLLAHADLSHESVFFAPEPKKRQKKQSRVWDIHFLKKKLGNVLCRRLLFAHAISGCDTTSRIFGMGKMQVFKKVRDDEEMAFIADQFLGVMDKADVSKHGNRAVFLIYNGNQTDCTNLDALRHIRFEEKAASSLSHVSCSSIPPTSAATVYHAQRVYLQIQIWQLNSNLNATDWGWRNVKNNLFPVHTDMPPAPADVLRVIRCGCKGDCSTLKCSCKKHRLDCSSACKECKGGSCSNTGNTEASVTDL